MRSIAFVIIGIFLSTVLLGGVSLNRDSIPFHQQKGWGMIIGFGLLSANSGSTFNGEIGSTGLITATYRLTKGHSIGLGAGTQLPAISSQMLHYPVYLQYQYFIDRKPNIKLGVRSGYSFASRDVMNNIYKADGGWMVEPFAGLKLNKSPQWAWNIEIGLLHQRLYYQLGDIDITGFEEHQNWRFWRFAFRTTIEI